jgi:uncharacterized protein GlcG (DUF336 family)
MVLDLAAAQKIVAAALAHARAHDFKPMGIGVIDARGALMAYAAEDGSAQKRAEIALGKARGAVAMGIGSRALMKRAEQQPYFILAAAAAIGDSLIPVPGGVLIKDATGLILGAAGASGDTSDNDEAALLTAIAAAGFTPDGG